MKIAVTGYEGRLGSELVENFGCVPLPCDVTIQESIKDALDKVQPDVIINCAAITNVDKCEYEDDYLEALKVNSFGIHYLLSEFGGRFIHISSDYVFSGEYGPYSEKDEETPAINGYGWSKWGGEVYALHANDFVKNVTVVRTTGLFGSLPGHSDFARYVIETLTNHCSFDAITTLIGNQTYIPFLAEGLMHVINLNVPIIHIASTDLMSRYEFALAIASEFGLDKKLIHPVKKIDSWIAPRPTKGGLKVRLAKSLGIPLYSILDGLKAFHTQHEKI